MCVFDSEWVRGRDTGCHDFNRIHRLICDAKVFFYKVAWISISCLELFIAISSFPSSDYSSVAPPSSFIHVSDFPSVSSLAQHLVKLAKDENEFGKYLTWTDSYDVIILNRFETRVEEIKRMVPERLNPFCSLCRALNEGTLKETKERDFWSARKMCKEDLWLELRFLSFLAIECLHVLK